MTGRNAPEEREPLLTVPNVISAARLAGVAPLLWAAWEGHRTVFVVVLVLLLASDWIDGTLATLLDQGTTVGARLDSATDAVMYASIAVSFWWMEGDVVMRELGWFVAVLVTWCLSGAVSLVRFRKLPSYHTRLAKISWFLTAVVALAWLLTGWSAGVPWVLAVVILTNLEAVGIGLVLPEWHVDVPTLLEARRRRSFHSN